MLYKKIIIDQIREEVNGFKTFSFKQGHNIQYKAGQYLTLVHQTNHEEIRRSYSIVSSPLLNEPLTIGVKRIENGVLSRHLVDRSEIGDELLTTGAAGFFTLPEDIETYKQVFFFAAGSGITPIFSLLKTVLHFHKNIHAVLIYSNSSKERTIFFKQLQKLAIELPGQFRLHFIFSDVPDLHAAHLNRDYLLKLLSKYSIADFSRSWFYLCGPETYMRMCTYTLQEEKVPKQNIRRETFLVHTRPHQSLPPDQATHSVKIYFENNAYEFDVHYPDSILQAARKNGINLPYSCETGRCGNCAAKCIQGNIWLSYNEVLTEKDLQNGSTLTCVGHPVNADVILKI